MELKVFYWDQSSVLKLTPSLWLERKVYGQIYDYLWVIGEIEKNGPDTSQIRRESSFTGRGGTVGRPSGVGISKSTKISCTGD